MMKNIWVNGMMGIVVGDALGMPVQFMHREEVKNRPGKTMEGYGTYNMPPGTWSDDSSMALATLDSMREKHGIDYPNTYICTMENKDNLDIPFEAPYILKPANQVQYYIHKFEGQKRCSSLTQKKSFWMQSKRHMMQVIQTI